MNVNVALAAASLLISGSCEAQARSARDTATAYGARLNAKGQPEDFNQNRVNNRINSRIDSRISLRIERYNPDSTSNPDVAYQVTQDDKSRGASAVMTPAQQQDDTQ